jgi:hypothetical protein
MIYRLVVLGFANLMERKVAVRKMPHGFVLIGASMVMVGMCVGTAVACWKTITLKACNKSISGIPVGGGPTCPTLVTSNPSCPATSETNSGVDGQSAITTAICSYDVCALSLNEPYYCYTIYSESSTWPCRSATGNQCADSTGGGGGEP